MEQWKRIYIDNEITNYEISSHGRCRNITKLGWKTKGLLKPKLNKKNGYCQYCIVLNGKNCYKYAHRLVAKYFIANDSKEKSQFNHKDGVKTNNVYTNLEWVTQEENMKHCFDNELCSSAKKVKIYDLKGNYINTYISITEAYRSLGIAPCWNSNFDVEYRQSHGYQFRFEDDETPVEDITDSCSYFKCGLVKLSMEGKFIKLYEAMTEAYDELGVADNGVISQVCKGRRKSYKGFKW